MLTLLAVVLGIGIGLLTGGRLHRLTGIVVRRVPLALAGFVIPLVTIQFELSHAPVLVAVGLVCVCAFAVSNLHLIGMGVVLIGVLTNLTPILVNGHFPVDPDALVAAELAEETSVDSVVLTGGRELQQPGDRLTFLGDVIPVPATGQVLSFGDLIILIGLTDVAAHLVMRRRRRRVQPRGGIEALRSINRTTPAHDWGTAPSPTPESASQYSASPDADAPSMLAPARASATSPRP